MPLNATSPRHLATPFRHRQLTDRVAVHVAQRETHWLYAIPPFLHLVRRFPEDSPKFKARGLVKCCVVRYDLKL